MEHHHIVTLDSIKLPLFYKEILCCFNECKRELHFEKRSPDDILQQPIWIKCNLVYKGNSVFFVNWIKSGILYIKDLFDDKGND